MTAAQTTENTISKSKLKQTKQKLGHHTDGLVGKKVTLHDLIVKQDPLGKERSEKVIATRLRALSLITKRGRKEDFQKLSY